MDIDEWTVAYKPIKNTLDDNAGYGGTMYETYGHELAFVRLHIEKNTVWTLFDSDNGPMIGAGYHLVNRIGYFITEDPWVDANMEITDDAYWSEVSTDKIKSDLEYEQ
jgi:hypothetical protein